MIASGILGATVVLVAVAVWLGSHTPSQPSPKPTTSLGHTAPTDSSNVVVTVVPSQPNYSVQQSQLGSTIQQMLQASTTTSFDASGFVQYVYAKVGVQLPRTIAAQAQAGTIINSPNQLEKGDLVFFNLDTTSNTASFDGIYLGSNQFAAVTTHGLMAISLSDSYWMGKFLYGRRVL